MHLCVYVDVKLRALDEVDKKNKSEAEIAKEYGVPAGTLSTWIKTVNLSDKVEESQTQQSHQITQIG